MISHEYKCIFIHIPRCGGSSIEEWLCGEDWWFVDPKTKHIFASQAKEIYKDYWDKYFKFSFVRHPVSRMVSCLEFGQYGLTYNRTTRSIDFEQYLGFFGPDIVLEYDARFFRRADIVHGGHSRGSIYGNILDEQLDFIGKLETISEDIKAIGKAVGKMDLFDVHIGRSTTGIQSGDLSEQNVLDIEALYRNDMARFGFKSNLAD
jgi:hypothetical protein